MTPEKKADQLIRKYTLDFTMDFDQTRLCACLCIDEIINFMSPNVNSKQAFDYWEQVRDIIMDMRTGKHEARADRFNEDLY
jgi:hypothetical protein